MGKYGKELKTQLILEWQNQYISYKLLKQLIKELILRKAIKNEDDDEINLSITECKIFSPRDSQSSQADYDSSLLANTFFESLDKEMKKFYLFYTTLERELYLQINTHLHKKCAYSNFNINQVHKELDSLSKIAQITNSFCSYINSNMISIKKILKKFHKKFNHRCGALTIDYLRKKVDQQNSDLNYMLQYKIIDEVNVIIEDLTKDLKCIFILLCKKYQNSENIIKINDNNSDLSKNSVLVKDPLLSKSQSTIMDVNICNSSEEVLSKNQNKFNFITKLLKTIDEKTSNRSKLKNWNFYISNEMIGSRLDKTKLLNLEANKSIMINNEDEDFFFLKNFLSKDIIGRKLYGSITDENRINLILCLLHTYLYMFLYTVIIPNNFSMLNEIRIHPAYTGLSLCFISIGAIVSTVFVSQWTRYSFKRPLIMSTLLFIAGNIVYIMAYQLESLILICLSRLIIGIGSVRAVNRRYLLEYVPKNCIKNYANYYLIAGYLGLASGPAINLATSFLEKIEFEYFKFNDLTYPTWVGILFSFFLLIIVSIFFNEPQKNKLVVQVNDTNKNMTKEEKKMINEIDSKLREINTVNRFSDTNLVSNSIKNIRDKNNAYLKKCFLILSSILFASRFVNESYSIALPLTLSDKECSFNLINIIMIIGFFFTIPFHIIFQKLRLTYPRERKIIIILLIFSLILSILDLDYILPDNGYRIGIGFILMVNSTNILEIFTGALMSKIIPSNWNICHFSVGFAVSFISNMGRIFGSILITFIPELFDYENIINFLSFIWIAIFGGVITIFLIYYSDLRLKAISRILKNHSFKDFN